ncbi:hypothetical protein ACIRP7_22630 [Streptomyces sp. NPDC102270]|uniref:hypothetical protein n=1 Tax=Streptomyces sp. NPDC102270 TaxID=3366150 RepID=UPI0038015C5C
MGTYFKDNPECRSEILFVGPVGLRPYTETVLQPPQATAELHIDILAPDSYRTVDFEDIMLVLEIKSPDGVRFVDHKARDNYLWGVPDGASWDESTPGAPTSRLRLRTKVGRLNSGFLNGLSHYVGIHGLPEGVPLAMSAFVTANRVVATTSSCPIQIQDLHVGERITGYLG